MISVSASPFSASVVKVVLVRPAQWIYARLLLFVMYVCV